jgi:hypothetical protein
MHNFWELGRFHVFILGFGNPPANLGGKSFAGYFSRIDELQGNF